VLSVPPVHRRVRATVVVLLVALIALPLSLVSARSASADPVVDQSNYGSGGGWLPLQYGPLGQNFVAAASGRLVRITFETQDVADFQVQVRDGGATGAVLQTVQVGGHSSWRSDSVAVDVPVTAGSRYAFVVTGGGTGYLRGTSPSYTAGTMWSYFRESDEYDLRFSTFVDSEPYVAPQITGAPDGDIVRDLPFDYQYPWTGYPAPAFSVDGTLPPGLELSATGRLTGTPRAEGVYDFGVVARNAAGAAEQSEEFEVRVGQLPEAPRVVAVTPGDGSVTVRWTMRSVRADPPITSYLVSTVGGSATCASTGDSCVVTGLTNGTAYRFVVAAHTPLGAGASSSPSAEAVPAGRPGAVVVSTTPGLDQIVLTWNAADRNGALDTPSYETQYRLPDGDWNTLGTGPLTTATYAGSAYDRSVEFRVRASTTGGVGDWSAIASARPLGTPHAPVAEAAPAAGSVLVSWAAPADRGSEVDGYRVEVRESGSSDWSLAGISTAPELLVTGLTDGTTYDFRVRATSAVGEGDWSAIVSAQPFRAPDAPVDLVLTPGTGEAGVLWQTPDFDGGSEVTGYLVAWRAAGAADWQQVALDAGTGMRLTGLVNGTPTEVRVAAVNAAGAGTWTPVRTVTPRDLPGAPLGLVLTPADGRVDVAWSRPDDDGGARVSGYRLAYRESGTGAWGSETVTTTSATIGGLVNGTAYEFRVSALNDAGEGAPTATEVSTPFTFSANFRDADGHDLDGRSLVPGDAVVVDASGLPEGATLVLELHSAPVVLGTAVVAPDGTVRLASAIPADAALGDHTLVATLTGTGAPAAMATADVRVVARASLDTLADPVAALARTGSGVAPVAALAAGVLMTGMLMLVAARSRRRA